jgi:hypothetical protein
LSRLQTSGRQGNFSHNQCLYDDKSPQKFRFWDSKIARMPARLAENLPSANKHSMTRSGKSMKRLNIGYGACGPPSSQKKSDGVDPGLWEAQTGARSGRVEAPMAG